MVKINLRNLEVFRAVVASGSATAAAQSLGVTQPAVSRMLAQLEKSIGCKLFFREKGRLHPTPEGLLYFEEVEIAFANLDRLSRVASDMRSLNVGQLRITAPPSMVEGLIPDVVAEFLIDHPGVQVTLDSHAPDQAKEIVATRMVDCGIGKLPIDHPGIVHEAFVTVDTVCAMPIDHPLRKLKTITPDDLRDQPLLLLGQGRTTRIRIEAAFKQYGITPKVRVETHTVGAACACAARGMGIAIVNGLMARQFTDRGVVLRPFRPGILHELVFMTPATTPRPRLTQAFFQACREHVKKRQEEYFVIKSLAD